MYLRAGVTSLKIRDASASVIAGICKPSGPSVARFGQVKAEDPDSVSITRLHPGFALIDQIQVVAGCIPGCSQAPWRDIHRCAYKLERALLCSVQLVNGRDDKDRARHSRAILCYLTDNQLNMRFWQLKGNDQVALAPGFLQAYPIAVELQSAFHFAHRRQRLR